MSKVQVWQCAEQLCHPRFFFRCCIFANSLPLMNSTSFNVVSVWRKYILCTMKWMILCNILTDHHKFFCCLPTSEQNLGSLLAMWIGFGAMWFPRTFLDDWAQQRNFGLNHEGGGGDLFWPGCDQKLDTEVFLFHDWLTPLANNIFSKMVLFLGKEGNATQL